MSAMSGKRKSYTPAYRREAAHLVIDTGRPIVQVAREISVGQPATSPAPIAQAGPQRWRGTSVSGLEADAPAGRSTTRVSNAFGRLPLASGARIVHRMRTTVLLTWQFA